MEKVKRNPAGLKKMVETFHMEVLHRGRDFDTAVVTISDVNRPALQLVGFYDYFDDKRLQILGRGEMRYLDRMTESERTRVFNQLLSYPFPAMIVARGMDIPAELQAMAEKHDRTLLRSPDSTVDVTSNLIDYLNHAMAPQIARAATAWWPMTRWRSAASPTPSTALPPRSSATTSRSAAWASSTCSSFSAWARCSSRRTST